MTLDDLPTPCLVLDRTILKRNIATMAAALARHDVPLRPHMKTAKSIDVARLALHGQPGGITVSTLAEAEYFAGHDLTDILYAVGIAPQKLDQVAKLNDAGADVIVLTDDPDAAGAIAAHPRPPRALIEIDTGESRGGVAPDDDALLAIADAAGPEPRRGDDACRAQLCRAQRRATWRASPRRSGPAWCARPSGCAPRGMLRRSSRWAARRPRCMRARFDGVTEVRAGVYMFGDLFQAEIVTHAIEDIAVTVLTSVIGRRPGELLVDAGGLALSKDRSTEAAPKDYGFGLALESPGQPRWARRSCGGRIRSTGWSSSIRRIRWRCRSAGGCGLRPIIRA